MFQQIAGLSMSAEKAAYLMARLPAKGIQAGMPFGGIPELTKTDIAAACSRLGSLQFHLVMAKYCDDVYSALKAVGEVQQEMRIRDSVWREMEPRRLQCIAAAIIDEVVGARRCRRCKGTGSTLNGTTIVTCPSCEGSGKRSISATSRAKSCGIPESTYRSQQINERFDVIARYLIDLEMGALERISRKAS